LPISIDYRVAEKTLLEALALAKGDTRLPVEWTSHARSVFELDSMTWTPAFATSLLAKATDNRVDTMSLKAESGVANAYSARGLCHKILVPAAVEHGFSIRNTGREPLNNQPFFRYDRIDKIDRVRNPADREYFFDVIERANRLTGTEALGALAAFLREALAIAAAARSVVVKTDSLTPVDARIASENFLLAEAPDRPRRLQAFAAACLDLLYTDVRTRRINDPSRDMPGDVHAHSDGSVVLAMEVRGKAVTTADLTSFATACESAGVRRAVVFVDARQHAQLDSIVVARDARMSQVAVFDSAASLLTEALLWSNSPLEKAVDRFAKGLLVRLREIEVTTPTLQEWSRAVAVAQSR
jgi:hypothetical protein